MTSARLLRHFWVLVLVGLVTGSCAPAGPGEAVFPIIGNDPDGLVETMEWGISPTTATFAAGEDTVLEILDSSIPEIVQIAVESGQCPPSAQVLVTGPADRVRVSLILGGSIAPVGVECGDILTTRALVIRFKKPIDLAGLKVSAERAPRVPGG